MKFRPLDAKLLIEPIVETEEKKTEGGIILPATISGDKNIPLKGKVLAVGNDEDLQSLVKEGDTVMYPQMPTLEFKMDGKTVIIMTRENILGVVE